MMNDVHLSDLSIFLVVLREDVAGAGFDGVNLWMCVICEKK